MIDDIDSFAAMFPGPPGEGQRVARKARAGKERRTQLTEKQRRRGAVRTAQLNFRCSPEFKERTVRLARRLDRSIADVMEMAIAELEDAVARLERANQPEVGRRRLQPMAGAGHMPHRKK